MKQEALKLALEALKKCHYYMIDAGLPNQSLLNEVFTAYKALETLAQHDSVQAKPELEQEHDDLTIAYMTGLSRGKDLAPQRTWVGLTDEEILSEAKRFALGLSFPFNGITTPEMFARAIEAKLKEKNT